MNLLSLLSDRGVITAKQAAAFADEARATGKGLEEVLEKAGVSTEDMLSAKGEFYGLPTRDLGDSKVPFEILRYIPEESASYYKLAPLAVESGMLEVGLVDPDNIEARDALNFISSKAGLPYKIYIISEKDFNAILKQYRGLTGEVGRALNELESELAGEKESGGGDDIEAVTQDDSSIVGAKEGETMTITEDAPVTKIVSTILRYAVEAGASDIHIEAMADRSRVRYRVDGTLVTSLTLPPKVHDSVVARIKVLSKMRLDERRKPQDGRFPAHIDGKKIDLRVSTFPTYYGEKVVMRLLGVGGKDWRLDQMGLSPQNLEIVRNAIKQPYGMILISGPTGSGKSTTLYAMLNEVDREHYNVLSLEDPIEYNIPGVSQSQVRPEIGYSFATGLRTTLRQDPNVIMVGEIRDKETAQLAVQAALTGHLVLSTIHTNNAVGIVPRLLDMGVDPYLIPPTLICGIAQRLVKTHCKGGEVVPVEGAMREMLDRQFADLPDEYRKLLPTMDHITRAKPTADCPTGMRGRAAMFEVMHMTPELERAILDHKLEDELYAIARKSGMLTMKEHAIIKSVEGTVPFEEVNTLGGNFEMIEKDTEAADIEANESTEQHA
jgi:type IV pilus assembly protein PilB